MDPEQTFIRIQERLSEMLKPRVRVALEYMCLVTAITLFAVLVFMHANYVQQPGCSSKLSGVGTADAQLIQIKITSAALGSQDEPEAKVKGVANSQRTKPIVDEDKGKTDQEEPHDASHSTVKETFRAAMIHFGNKWQRFRSFTLRCATRIIESLWKIAGIHLNFYAPKWLHILHVVRVNLHAVKWPEKGSEAFEPTYLYTTEKGYFFLPEGAKTRHNISTVNISISPQHSCFGNRWQQLLINWFVGYDTILMNSILHSPGEGYLYNHQTKEFYDLSHAHDPPESPARFGDYLVMKCGVLMMSLFVFFTTTMSVSFTLRETQTRMLKFTVQLQHHARHRLPTFQLIFVHVIESLVFVPIMIGILFFLFEFYEDQLLAFMVLVLVWLCELFTLVSVRTPISMKFFPRFFLLYFLVFHIYFFSYPYGFSYLALSTTVVIMMHLILYFWNRFEVPALQRFLQTRRSQVQQHRDFHITASTILASTLHITRLNSRNSGPPLNPDAPGPGPIPDMPGQASADPDPGAVNYLGSMLSMLRDVSEQGQAFDEAEASLGTS